MINRYADDNGIFFIETSAKTPKNVKELFVAIARKLPKETTPTHNPGGIVLENTVTEQEKSGCCKSG